MPQAPLITSYSIGSGTSGINYNSATGVFYDVTSDNSVKLSGTAEAGSTITVFDGTTEIGTAVTNSAGAWSYVTGPLPDGSNNLTATATDLSGTSPASSVLDVSVNSDVTITSNTDGYTNSTWQYIADNGVYNVGNMVNGTNFTVSLTLDPATFPNGVEFSWSFPVQSYWNWDVQAMPNVKYFAHDASGNQTFTQLANFTNLTANYAIQISGKTSQTDVAFDLFFYSSPAYGTPVAEVEVLVHSPWTGFGSNEPFSVTVPGLTNAEVNYINSSTPLILVSTPTDVLSDSISISGVLKTLVWNGLLSAQDYIGCADFGSEVSGGTGGLDINNLSYTWTANPSVVLAAGNNTYVVNSMGGNNITGNGAVDTVVYASSYSNYQIKSSGSQALITEANNIATMDVLQGISYIQFSNGTYNIATGSFAPLTAAGPTLSSLVESPLSGDLDAGKTVTFTLNLSEAVTVASGTPTLTLNDGGTATYTGGTGTSALTFSYTVAAGQNTSSLAATAVNLNSATITDGAGNAANLSLSGLTQNGPQVDTITPTITSLAESPSSSDLSTGKTVTLSLNLSEAVTVAGGTPTLTLNDGGTATYTGGSGTSALTFSYTVGAGQNTSSLAATAVNLNSATITDGAGNAANLSLSGLTQNGPQVDTVTPTITSLAESPANGDLNAGKVVTITLGMSEIVTVNVPAARRRCRLTTAARLPIPVAPAPTP